MGETNTNENKPVDLNVVLQNVLRSLAELETLRIETTVSELTFKNDRGKMVLEPKEGAAEGIVTKVQFLRGDIAMHMSPGMLAGVNQPLMEAHTRHVAESREIIRTNIKAFVDLVDQLLKR